MINRRQTLWAVIVVVAGLLTIAVITAALVSATTATRIRAAQVSNTRTLDSSQRTLRLVEDCTTPGGVCYERSKKQTGDAVADINRVVILAAACSVGLPRDLTVGERQTRIQSCVIERLAQS